MSAAEAIRYERFHDARLYPQENKAVEMTFNGFCVAEIAEELDVSRPHVSALLSRARGKGVDVWAIKSPRAGWTNAQIYALRARGLNYEQIAERTGNTRNSIGARLSMYRRSIGIPPQPQRRWSQDTLAQWCLLRRRGFSCREIAMRFGTTRNAVLGATSRAANKHKGRGR